VKDRTTLTIKGESAAPAAVGEAGAEPLPALDGRRAEPEVLRILLADDDPTSRLITQTALRNLGHQCQTVIDGFQAWEAYLTQRPDVVISDWMMPGLDGLELCRKIRDQGSGGYTYFVMVTSQKGLDQVIEGMTAGADDYLIKPLNPNDLRGRLIAAARVTNLHRQLAIQRDQLTVLNAELVAIARRDPLTGLGNRRALQEDLELLEARVARYGHRYCMALLDIDHFKSYNDTYGHLAGDKALQAVADLLKDQARGGDALYRYGGEEFLCIFPEQSLATGTIAAQRMRSGLESLAIPHIGNDGGVLTLSAGLAVLDQNRQRLVPEVLKEADDALYRAKQLGRNRIEYATPQPPPGNGSSLGIRPALDDADVGDEAH
jgi:two-component system cell cycle response regulator